MQEKGAGRISSQSRGRKERQETCLCAKEKKIRMSGGETQGYTDTRFYRELHLLSVGESFPVREDVRSVNEKRKDEMLD